MIHEKKAFSLIELSIVILVIGILVAGVAQADKMIKKFRLGAARSLTNSSPVSGIYGLALWLDTTSEKSFLDSETVDGSRVSTWYSINPQKEASNFKLTSSGTLRPFYTENVLNGLPGLKFRSNTMSGTFLGSDLFSYNESTVFIVEYLDNLSATYWPTGTTVICWNCTTNPNRFWLNLATSSASYVFSNTSGSATASSYNYTSHYNKAELITLMHKSSNYSEYRVNGTIIALHSSDSSTITPSTSAALQVGSYGGFSGYFTGYFGEVIFYNRSLTAVERTSVETYLKQKWGIK